ncbi:MAG: sugar transferase [Mogibacterium sp.]|nr:sugar transferase [Mogibacterium sp.]
MVKQKQYQIIKRGLDIVCASLMLGITSPALAVISILVKAETRGPAFYIHERVGRNGKKIRIYKFRSMKVGSDELESTLNDEDLEKYYQEYKLQEDPRVTKIGHTLRKLSLDELPQLINIVKGEMSLIGPRPVMEGELAFYTDEERAKFLSAKPGLSGYWQVYARNDATYQSGRRQEMELYYVDNASLALDVKLFLMTPVAIFLKRGI